MTGEPTAPFMNVPLPSGRKNTPGDIADAGEPGVKGWKTCPGMCIGGLITPYIAIPGYDDICEPCCCA